MSQDIVLALGLAHRNMERVLTLMRLQLDALQAGSSSQGYTFLNNCILYMYNYPGLLHHPTEEILFTRLARQAPETRELCLRLSAQHQTFHRQETALLKRIRLANNGDPTAWREIKEVGAGYCSDHSEHIRSEDREALPQAVQKLPASDWSEVRHHSKTMLARLSEQRELERNATLYDYLMSEQGRSQVH